MLLVGRTFRGASLKAALETCMRGFEFAIALFSTMRLFKLKTSSLVTFELRS
jgi:hypothetical protein